MKNVYRCVSSLAVGMDTLISDLFSWRTIKSGCVHSSASFVGKSLTIAFRKKPSRRFFRENHFSAGYAHSLELFRSITRAKKAKKFSQSTPFIIICSVRKLNDA